jgi:hypothetical protein
MKSIVLSAALAALLCAGLAQAADKPDFSGEWKCNIAKSDFGQMPNKPEKLTRTIVHKDPNVQYRSTIVGQQGERTTEFKCTTDGKDCINKFFNSEGASKMTWDGSKLVAKSKREFQGNELNITETWELSADGKTLTITNAMNSSMGDMVMKTVFEK